MTPVGEPIIEQFNHWPGGAPSGVLFLDDGVTVTQTLKDSAIICHTYPEDDWVEVLLDSCRDIPDHEEVAIAIRDRWALKLVPECVVWVPRWGQQRQRKHPRYVDDNWPYMMEALTHYTVVSPLLQKPADVAREAAVNLIP
jgi:hypothetical protein